MLSPDRLTKFVRSKVFLAFVACFIILAALPLLIRNDFLLFVSTLIFVYAIYAASWNFLANSGQGSLGHAVFLGIGGFASAIIGTRLSLAAVNALKLGTLPFGVLSVVLQISVILVGGVLSAGIGLLIGLACVRLKAWYLAMVTFGFLVIIGTLSSQFDSITNGINGFTPPDFVPAGFPFYILVISFAIASIGVMYALMKSRIGFAFRAIHGNEAEAKMIGINTAKYKLIAFTISTFFAGIAGGLYVYFFQFVQNSIFSPDLAFLPLIMTVIGGLGTVAGPIIGAIFLTSIQQVLSTNAVANSLSSSLGQYFPNVGYAVGPPLTYLIIGVVLIVIVIFSPKGLEPLFRKFYKYLTTEEKKDKAVDK